MKVGHEAQNNARRAASLLARLNLQRQHLQFCDCVISQGHGQVYSVHRCILAASSPVLASYLSSTGILVVLEEPCLSDSVLELLIDYIYTGTLPYLDNKLYSDLLAAAQYLEMDELQSALRTKIDDMEYHNKSAVSEATTSTKFALLPPQIHYYEKTPNSPHSVCSTENEFCQFTTNIELSNDRQINSYRTDLSSDAETEQNNRRVDLLKAGGLGDAPMKTSNMTVNSCCIPENDMPSQNFIQNIGSTGETQQVSIVCPEREKDQSAIAIKQDTWQESKEELCGNMEHRSYLSCSTEEQKNEDLTVEKAPNLCLQSPVKSEEMQSKSLGSHCCFTSSPPPRCGVVPVICHSSRAARIFFSGSSTADKLPSERTYCNDIVEDGKTQNEHYINHKNCIWKQNQDSVGSVRPEQEYNSANGLFKEIYKQLDSEQSNQMFNYFDSESSNNKVQYELDNSCKDFSNVQNMTRVTSAKDPTQSQAQKKSPLTKEKSNTRIKFTYKGICGKRKLKEEHSDKCSKSAKNVCHCNVHGSKTESHTNRTEADNSTNSSSADEQDTIVEYKNTSISKTSKLCRSLLLPAEDDTCKHAFSGTEQYSGHLYYHCNSQPGTNKPSHIRFSPNLRLTPDSRLNYSDESSEDNDAPLFGILSQKNQHSAAFDKERVLLDISTKSAEMFVSYKHTSEMERTCVGGFTDKNLMKTESKISANDGEYQESHRVSSHKEEKILSSSLTSCTSACGKDCVHDSVASYLSDHIPISPASSMQTNISKHLSSPGHHGFQCSLCERSFSQRGSLNRHVRSHLGVRPFPCPQCPMTFSRQYRVTEHMRVHQRSALGNDFTKPPASSV